MIFFVELSTFKTFYVVGVLIFVKFSHKKFAYSFYVLIIILYCQMWLKIKFKMYFYLSEKLNRRN